MRKPLLVALGLLLMAGALVAQHDNATEKKVSDTVLFTTDVSVGSAVLKAGEYRVACDTKKVTFTRQASAKDQEWLNTLDPMERLAVQKSEKALEVPCLGRDMGEKFDHTIIQLGSEQNGVRTLDKLYLRGSAIEHVFK